MSSSDNYIICTWFLTTQIIVTLLPVLCWHNAVTGRNHGWFFMITVSEERADFSGCSERPLWSKIAQFVFPPLIRTKHLTPLMNSFCWIKGVESGQQEIARWRDRLSLSEQLTAELKQHQWGSSNNRNATQKTQQQQIPLYIQWCVRFRARYQQCTDDRNQAWMLVRRQKPCCFAHWQMTSTQTPGIFH